MPRRKQPEEKATDQTRDFEAEVARQPSVDEVASIAVRRRIDQLGGLERRVVSWIYGIGCKAIEAEEVADRLNLTVDQVWDMVEESVQLIGYRVVTELAA